MIILARIFARYEYDAAPVELSRIADAAFRVSESAADEILPLDEFGIDARVQTGSTEVIVVVFAALQTVISALVAYGGGAEGFDRLKADLGRLRDRIVRQVPREAEIPSTIIGPTRLTTTGLGKLERLISSVRCGEITPQAATESAIHALAKAGEPSDPRVHRELASLFGEIEVRPSQTRELAPLSHEIGVGPGQYREIAPPVATSVPADVRYPTKPVPVKKSVGVRIWRNPGEVKRHTEEY